MAVLHGRLPALLDLNASAHHLVNLLFHIANTLLLFIVLNRMTAASWRSALVAALFALHPLHVESVAWVAERWDVLSAFFWMLTMLAYVHYVENPNRSRYALTLGLYALGLMSKPMLVTLPFVFLLLDYWPLGRTRWASSVGQRQNALPAILLLEKLPFFALTVVTSIITYWAEQRGGSIVLLDRLPIIARLTNLLMSYAVPGKYSLADESGRLLSLSDLVGGCSVWCAGGSGRRVVAGGLEIKTSTTSCDRLAVVSGNLVPVIGLVQVGTFSMADRYMYIPSVGLFLMLAWCLPGDLAKRSTIRIPATRSRLRCS